MGPSWHLLLLVVLLAVLLALSGALSPGVARAQEQGDLPVVGAWTGGPATAGVFREGQWFLRFEHAGGSADASFWYGRSGDEPVAGDWDGDGQATVGVRRGNRFFL
ncbi:MAG: hypothetical protein EA340_00400, partial [Nitriliruptor sp.]